MVNLQFSTDEGPSHLATFLDGYRKLAQGDDFLWDLADFVALTLGLDDLVIYVRHGESLMQSAAYGIKAADRGSVLDRIAIPMGHAVVGRAARDGQPVLVRDVRLDPTYVADHFEGLSELAVPSCLDGSCIAVIDSESSEVDGFTDWQMNLLENIALIVAPSIELWRMRQLDAERAEATRTRQAEALDTFAGSVAHDLNNLLGVVELNAALLRRDPSAAANSAESLTKMVDRARVLTSRLLTLTSRGTLALEILDIEDLVVEAAEVATLLPEIKVNIELPDRLPVVRADPVQIPQVLLNLVTNAIEAMDAKGELTIEATVGEAESGKAMLTISVTDTGPGIADEDIERIFEPYFTTKEDGLGLGLASSYWTAIRHSGALELSETGPRGSTFSLTLPATDARVVTAPPATPAIESLRILVLDDDPGLGEVLSALLDNLGHEHELVVAGEHVAPSWERAVANGEPFDVALLDLRNEIGLGGLDAIRELRSVDPNVRAVAMSGYADQTLEQSRSAGFCATLQKPFRLNELVSALDRAFSSCPGVDVERDPD